MLIDAVLFDADRVIQRPTIDVVAALGNLVSPEIAADFVNDVTAVVRTFLVGKGDDQERLAAVLERWNLQRSTAEVFALWRQFEIEPAVLKVIQELRAHSIDCHLATNQPAYRRAIMNDERHYGDLFDQSFYSCDLGLAKPDPAYFTHILRSIDRPACSVLFIDDSRGNVAGARSAGLHAETYHLELGIDALLGILRAYGLPVTR